MASGELTLNPNQLIWRCRRGVRELDVLFERFLQSSYPNLTQAEQLAFAKLLEVQDPTIMDWLFGKSIPEDPELHKIVEHLKLLSGLTS